MCGEVQKGRGGYYPFRNPLLVLRVRDHGYGPHDAVSYTHLNTAALALLCGTSMLFSYIISLEQVPAAVATVVTGITDNKYIFLFVVNIVFLLLGCVLDVSTIQLVFVPMVLPLVKAFGIDLVHFGVVICLNTVSYTHL